MVASAGGKAETGSQCLHVKAPENPLLVSLFREVGIDDEYMIVAAENKFSGFTLSDFRGIVLSAGLEDHFIIDRRSDGLSCGCGNLYRNAFCQCCRSAIDRNRYG